MNQLSQFLNQTDSHLSLFQTRDYQPLLILSQTLKKLMEYKYLGPQFAPLPPLKLILKCYFGITKSEKCSHHPCCKM